MFDRPTLLVLACTSLTLALATGAGCDRADDSSTSQVRVRVRSVLIDHDHGAPVLLLEEIDGARRLPIWIGIDEARSIALQLEERALPRPNGHDLARQLLGHLDAELERVIVTGVRDGTFYALMRIETPDKWIELDARPSDAIAIALRTGAPIFVLESVFERSVGSEVLREPELEL